MTDYQVTNTTPAIYLDKAGKAVTGYTVSLYFPAFDEIHTIQVPGLALDVVKAAAENLYAQRVTLSKLGTTTK